MITPPRGTLVSRIDTRWLPGTGAGGDAPSIVRTSRTLRWIAVALLAMTTPALADPVTLASVFPSSLNLRLTYAGSMPGATNPTSPVAVGDALLLIEQTGTLSRRDPKGSTATLLTPGTAPAGLALTGWESILNVAANETGDTVYVMFTSWTSPAGTPVSISSRGNDTAYQVVYSYDFDGVALTNPQAIRSFEVNHDGHTGGGMVVLDDGSILLAFGDNGDAFEDGRTFAQDDLSHLSKIVRLDPVTGDATTVGKGLRNVQRLDIASHDGFDYLEFVDIGGNIAEELNRVLLSDLLDTGTIENFGWGRNADGFAREGTFYIDANGDDIGAAPLNESGFVQPLAQWGREAAPFAAGSGPISCGGSFTDIGTLFGDLPSGLVYAVLDGASGIAQDVFQVNLFDAGLAPTTLTALAGGRPDPRFFCFGNDMAGVLLEGSGDFYLLDEFTPVPEPGTLSLIALPVMLLWRRRTRRSQDAASSHE